MESNPELLQWREEGVKPPHLEKKWVLALMVGEREWEYIREIEWERRGVREREKLVGLLREGVKFLVLKNIFTFPCRSIMHITFSHLGVMSLSYPFPLVEEEATLPITSSFYTSIYFSPCSIFPHKLLSLCLKLHTYGFSARAWYRIGIILFRPLTTTNIHGRSQNLLIVELKT